MKKIDHMLFLRIGFGIFFLFWGLERSLRVDTWASENMLGSFYGSLGPLRQRQFRLNLPQSRRIASRK